MSLPSFLLRLILVFLSHQRKVLTVCEFFVITAAAAAAVVISRSSTVAIILIPRRHVVAAVVVVVVIVAISSRCLNVPAVSDTSRL